MHRRHVEHAERGRRPDAHQPGAADDVRPQRIFGQPVRRRQHHVAAERRHVADMHQVPVAGLEEPRRVEDVDLGAEDLAQEHRADADRQVRLADRALRDRRRSSPPPNVAPTNGRICRSAAEARAATSRRPATSITALRARIRGDHRPKIDRNSRANGETVTSPADRSNGRDSPELLASRISVSPRCGSVDDHRRRGVVADAELPDHRAAVVALHEPAVAVRQRLAVARRWAASTRELAIRAASRCRFFSARSNCSRSRTVEIMPDAGVSVDATYEDAVARPRASTA